MGGVTDVIQRVFYGEPDSYLLLKVMGYVFLGLLLGSDAWSDREAEYQIAVREARTTALPDSKTSP